MEHSSEILKIIEAGLDGDATKVRNYTCLLHQKLDASDTMKKAVERRLKGKHKNMPVLKTDETLEKYKPKNAPCHYTECLDCDMNDGSFSVSIFGLCLTCWKKYKKKIPNNLQIPLGRLLLYPYKPLDKK